MVTLVTKFENPLSSFPSPDLSKTQNTDFNETVVNRDIFENTPLSEEEQEGNQEQLSQLDSFHGKFASISEGEITLVPSRDDHDLSEENIALEIDIPGSPIDMSSLKEETKEDKIRYEKISYGVGCTKDLHVLSQQSGNRARMTTETHPVDHTGDLYVYNAAMRMDRGHFYSYMNQDSIDPHSDRKAGSGKQSSIITENDGYGHSVDFIQDRRIYATSENPLKFNECRKSFSQSSELIKLKRTHTGEKPFKCSECGETFHHSDDFIKHRRTHTGGKPFKCNECGKTFSHSSSLITHRRTHTGEKPSQFNECGKTFIQSSGLIVHKRTHTREKPFKCHECGMTFIQSSSLIVHNRTHTGEKPFNCSKCGNTFSQSSSLIKHMRTHTGEMPFKCNECGKTFSQSSSLIKHRRTHTGEKPFKCIECGKTFSRSCSLITHRRTHKDENTFSCNECGKTFNNSSNLKRHRRKHIGEMPF